MNFPKTLRCAALAGAATTLFITLVPQSEARAAWAHEEPGALPPREDVVYGVLDNGMRYAILPWQEPPGRASLRLYVNAGSLMEEEDQRGLAHFIEHMAFNGTENFAPGEMVEFFQRLGMRFGADTNAHTGFDETVYKVELPEVREAYLEEGFTLLRDYADRMLLLEEEIEDERGVILAEKRARDSVEYRTLQAYWDFIFPRSRIPGRFPIGTVEVIRNAPREEFVAFYETWYRPERMAFVVVGDIEPEAIEARIEAHFGDMSAPAPAPAPVDLGEVLQPELAARLHTEPEARTTDIGVVSLAPFDASLAPMERRARELVTAVAETALNRRLERLAREEDAPFTEGTAYSWDYLRFVEITGLEIVTQPADWQEALALGEQELRRALEHGFTQAEVEEARARILQRFEKAQEAAPTAKARGLADQLARSINRHEVFTSPETDLAFARAVLREVTPRAAHAAFRERWGGEGRSLFVSGNLELDKPQAELTQAWRSSSRIAVAPPEEAATPSFAYTDFGEPGEVTAETVHEELGITQLVFDNNVRLNYKYTDYRANAVSVGVRFGGGLLDLPKDRPALAPLAGGVYVPGGLVKHPYDEIQRIFAGKNVDVNFAVGENAFTLSGDTRPADLDHQLNLMAAYLVAPAYREEAEALARRQLEETFVQLERTVEGVLRDEAARFLHGGDPRFGFPSRGEFAATSLADVREWLEAPRRDAYLEVSVVGDIDEAAARATVARTFGALPERSPSRPAYSEAREVTFPRPGTRFDATAGTALRRALAAGYWETVGMEDISTARRLSLLSRVYDDRLRKRLREEMGEAYSPYAYHDASDVFPGYGHLTAVALVAPGQTETVHRLLRDIAASLAEGGVDMDEFERMQAPLLNSLEEYRRDNRYWLERVLMGSSWRPRQLDWARTIVEDYESMTPEEISALASEYLGGTEPVEVIITPAVSPVEP